jgi:hypothetical protein
VPVRSCGLPGKCAAHTTAYDEIAEVEPVAEREFTETLNEESAQKLDLFGAHRRVTEVHDRRRCYPELQAGRSPFC